jgi:hypothetical protein
MTVEKAPRKRAKRASPRPIVDQTYRHYKGDLYTVESIVFHHETRERMVVYRSHKYGWRNVRPVRGTKSDPDGWLTPVKDENGKKRPRFQSTNLVLLLAEQDGTWLAMCQASADMREVRGKTLAQTQAKLRRQWVNPLPLRFPEDFPLMDREFESMMSHGKLHEIDPLFTWYVLDKAAREKNLRTALGLRVRTTRKSRRR